MGLIDYNRVGNGYKDIAYILERRDSVEKEYYDEDEIDLVEVARTLWRGKLLIAVITMVGLLVGAVYVAISKPVYQSTATLKVATAAVDQMKTEISGTNVGEIPYVLNNMKEELENPALLGENVVSVAVSDIKQTTLLKVAVNASDPAAAKEACVALLDDFKKKEKDKLQRELAVAKEVAEQAKQQAVVRAQTMSANNNWQSGEETVYTTSMQNCYTIEKKLALFDDEVMVVVAPPSYSERPVAPDKMKVIGIALLTGFVLGCAIVLLRNFIQSLPTQG